MDYLWFIKLDGELFAVCSDHNSAEDFTNRINADMGDGSAVCGSMKIPEKNNWVVLFSSSNYTTN